MADVKVSDLEAIRLRLQTELTDALRTVLAVRQRIVDRDTDLERNRDMARGPSDLMGIGVSTTDDYLSKFTAAVLAISTTRRG